MKKAVLLISHGSRSAKTKEEVLVLVDILKKMSGLNIVECAFLELESPSISQGIDICALHGATDIIILLNFLNSGRHVDTDIPQIVNEAAKNHPQIHFTITKPVGQHTRIANLFYDLIQQS